MSFKLGGGGLDHNINLFQKTPTSIENHNQDIITACSVL